MALARSLWFFTFVVVRAQKSPHTDETQSALSLKTPSAKTAPLKFLSYNPSEVCFNPQYDPYFKNDLLSTSPVPKPNIYFNRPESVACPRSLDHSPQNYFPVWPGSLPSCVPLVFIPTAPTSGHLNRRMIKYLKNLKNALDADPLLATRNRTAAIPRNRVQVKFGAFPPADALPEAFSQSVRNAEPQTSRGVRRIDEIKAQKMASYLIDHNRRRRKRENSLNVYPLPKFVYDDHRIPEPTTFYDRNLFLSEIFN